MKLAIGSDLHLEFGTFEPVNAEGADVLILSGDIMVAQDLHRFPVDYASNYDPPSRSKDNALNYRLFLAEASKNFKHVLYVAGNHEFYHGKFNKTIDILIEECLRFDNVKFLEKDTVKIDDVLFVGGTLWTDMNQGDPLTQHAIMDMMNDYQLIVNDSLGYVKLRPAHTIQRHRETLQYFQIVAKQNAQEKIVVVGHHAPTRISTHPRYKNDTLMNGAYSSDLSEFILDHPQIKLWTHGHTHSDFDYMVGETRIVCNPRGYVNHERGSHEQDPYHFKYVEV